MLNSCSRIWNVLTVLQEAKFIHSSHDCMMSFPNRLWSVISSRGVFLSSLSPHLPPMDHSLAVLRRMYGCKKSCVFCFRGVKWFFFQCFSKSFSCCLFQWFCYLRFWEPLWKTKRTKRGTFRMDMIPRTNEHFSYTGIFKCHWSRAVGFHFLFWD